MPFLRRRKADSEREQPEDAEQTPEGKAKGSWKRPANTAFKQQRLKAWQPILTPKVVLPTFFILGLLFAPIGGLLIWGSNLVSQITIDYTNCDQQTPQTDPINPKFSDVEHYSYNLRSKDSNAALAFTPQWAFVQNQTAGDNQTTTQTCYLRFDIPADLQHSVFLYYKLTNFYQNHRRYVKSLDTDQLRGDDVSLATLDKGDCAPLAKIDGKRIYPCGLIANSMFNDTIVSTTLLNPQGSNSNQTYNFTEAGIAWPGERKKYTARPSKTDISQLVPPPGWAKRFPNNYTEENFPNLQEDLHFQNWMRTAALPTFTKLYARNDQETMAKGMYQIMIWTNFPVRPYSGTKSIVISTVSWIGGKNPFLGWAYVGGSGLLVLLGIAGTIRHLIKPRRLGDMSMLSWNQPTAR